MGEKIITIYCLCDDILKGLHHYEDPQRHMSDAEVITTAIVAMLSCRGNFEHARAWLMMTGHIPKMLSKSRLNRRLHRISDLLIIIFEVLGDTYKQLNTELIYAIDSFPIAVCDNIRISRSKIYQNESYRGYTASKRRYFYGLKIHLMVTKSGQPVEFFLTPESFGDVAVLDQFSFDLPEWVIVYADKAYNDYNLEDLLKEAGNIQLLPIRKENSKRALPPYVAFVQHHYRKIIETTGSIIERLLPKTIHAVTPRGFELKVVLFVLACSINYL